jgi:hypothetical protein
MEGDSTVAWSGATRGLDLRQAKALSRQQCAVFITHSLVTADEGWVNRGSD